MPRNSKTERSLSTLAQLMLRHCQCHRLIAEPKTLDGKTILDAASLAVDVFEEQIERRQNVETPKKTGPATEAV